MTNERTTGGWRCGRLQRADGGLWVLGRVGFFFYRLVDQVCTVVVCWVFRAVRIMSTGFQRTMMLGFESRDTAKLFLG